MATVCVLTGATLGLSTTLYANALRKTYLMRAPWRHLGGIIGGSLLGYGYYRLNENETKKLAILKQKYIDMYGVNMSNPVLVQAPFLRPTTSAEAKEESADE